MFHNASFLAVIPFGWGQEQDSYYAEEQIYIQQHGGIEISDRATLKGSAAAVKALNSVSPTDDNSHRGIQTENSLPLNEDNPHEMMAIEMTKTGTSDSNTVALVENDISSDIFDESLRYSALNRPKLNIEYADSDTPSQQRRGSFIPEEERIANLFSTKKKKK